MPARRVSNLLPLNLPQLQNLIKRDADSYTDEFHMQWRHFETSLDAFALQPSQPDAHLEQLVAFVTQVAHCFPKVTAGLADTLVGRLRALSTTMESGVRLTMLKSLVLLHNRGAFSSLAFTQLAFDLLRCHDRELREFLRRQIVGVVKGANQRRKNVRFNSSLQGYMFTMLKDSHAKAAKISLDVMIELYKGNVWNDQKTVNAVATALFSNITKVMVAALQFFLGKDEVDEASDSESDDDNDLNAKAVLQAARHSRKTRKKQKEVAKARRLVGKAKKKKKHAETFNFSALHLINDPQGLADRLYHKLETSRERYEVKLMLMNLIARLVGVHELFVFNFYVYLQRYVQPQQRDVTRVLQIGAQACHALVPPDVLRPLVLAVANNFVTERNSAEVITVGINAIKEMCLRAPLVMPDTLLHDLAQYKKYRDKNVVMAARALIQFYRQTHPEMLHKKDRGRPTEALVDLVRPQYGAVVARDYIPGAETLNPARVDEKHEDRSSASEHDSDSEGWQDVIHSSDEAEEHDESGDSSAEEQDDVESDVEYEAECEAEDKKSVNTETTENHDYSGGEKEPDSRLSTPTVAHKVSETESIDGKSSVQGKISECVDSGAQLQKQRAELASVVIGSRLLTDAEFRHIDHVQLARHMDPLKKGKRKASSCAEQVMLARPAEIVSRQDIERIHKRIREDKDSRLATAKLQKPNRAELKFGQPKGKLNEHSSTTNREKKKTKNFMMVRHKMKSKTKKSFQEKQRNLRNALLKRRKKSRY